MRHQVLTLAEDLDIGDRVVPKGTYVRLAKTVNMPDGQLTAVVEEVRGRYMLHPEQLEAGCESEPWPPSASAPVVNADSLVPTLAMEAVRRVFEYGHRTHYAAMDNGEEPDTRDRVYHLRKADSHMGEYESGERRDEETGESPLAHVITRLMLALELDLRGRQ